MAHTGGGYTFAVTLSIGNEPGSAYQQSFIDGAAGNVSVGR